VWWLGGGELGGGVFGFPSLSFGDGVEEQDGSWWDVGVGGCGAFPHVRSVVGAVGGLDAGGVEELPNECAAFGAVVIEGPQRPPCTEAQRSHFAGLPLARPRTDG